MNKRLVELVMLFVVAALVSAMATSSRAQSPAPAAAAAAMSSGEVRSVDKGAGKITIKHGPLVNLDMPGMTMAFRVRDPSVLDRFKAGDRIAFVAEKDGSALVVTKIEAAK